MHALPGSGTPKIWYTSQCHHSYWNRIWATCPLLEHRPPCKDGIDGHSLCALHGQRWGRLAALFPAWRSHITCTCRVEIDTYGCCLTHGGTHRRAPHANLDVGSICRSVSLVLGIIQCELPRSTIDGHLPLAIVLVLYALFIKPAIAHMRKKLHTAL